MTSLQNDPSLLLEAGFILLSIALAVGLGYSLRSYKVGVAALVWLIITGLLGAAEVLADFSSVPPRVLLIFGPMLIAVFVIAKSSLGKRFADLSLGLLIGFQAFRILVELLIHQAVLEGIAPPQMTWSGMNLDILTGISALVLAPFALRAPKWLLLGWNTAGLALLLWVVGVAILSMPTPFQQIEPDNTWVAFFPFIWLPSIMVTTALLGHFVLFRKLLKQ